MLYCKSVLGFLECRYPVMANISTRIVAIAVSWNERCTLSWNDFEFKLEGSGW